MITRANHRLTAQLPIVIVWGLGTLTLRSTPPQIVVQPANQPVVEGQPATLQVTATGTAPLHYQWHFAAPTNGSFAPIPGATDPAYMIPAVAPEHTGSYYCNVRTSETSVDSQSALVSLVRDLPNVSLTIVSPANGSVFPTPVGVPTRLTIAAHVIGENSRHRWVEFSANGTNLGLIGGTSEFSLNWSNVVNGEYTLNASSLELVDGAWITFAAPPVTISVPYGGLGVIVPGDVWTYHDDEMPVSPDWNAVDYNDDFWFTGQAQFGYGDGDEATMIRFAFSPDNTNYITSYFRRHFEVPEPAAYTNLFVRLLRDDGAVVYLNGVELFRDNLPEGPIGRFTLASRTISGTEESTYVPWRIDPALLRPGINLLAVELHQAFAAAGDASFDLALIANVPLSPPSLRITRSATTVRLSWPGDGAGYRPQSSTLPDSSAAGGWEDVNSVVTFTGSDFTTQLNSAAGQQFFRLVYE